MHERMDAEFAHPIEELAAVGVEDADVLGGHEEAHEAHCEDLGDRPHGELHGREDRLPAVAAHHRLHQRHLRRSTVSICACCRRPPGVTASIEVTKTNTRTRMQTFFTLISSPAAVLDRSGDSGSIVFRRLVSRLIGEFGRGRAVSGGSFDRRDGRRCVRVRVPADADVRRVHYDLILLP